MIAGERRREGGWGGGGYGSILIRYGEGASPTRDDLLVWRGGH